MLTHHQIRDLKAQAHHQKPVIMIGQHGLSDAVLAELDIALTAHELVKIKIAENDKNARHDMIQSLCEKSGAELVQAIGKVAVVYRKNPED